MPLDRMIIKIRRQGPLSIKQGGKLPGIGKAYFAFSARQARKNRAFEKPLKISANPDDPLGVFVNYPYECIR